MANRLATENRNFLEYVKLIKQFYQTGEARLADGDVPKTQDYWAIPNGQSRRDALRRAETHRTNRRGSQRGCGSSAE